jgi:hypothetical protein
LGLLSLSAELNQECQSIRCQGCFLPDRVEFYSIWKEAAVAYFEVLLWNVSGGIMENYEKPVSTAAKNSLFRVTV